MFAENNFAVNWRIYQISPRIPYRNCCIVTLLEQYSHTCTLLALYIHVLHPVNYTVVSPFLIADFFLTHIQEACL